MSIQGKRIGIFGFSEPDAGRIALDCAHHKAFSRTLDEPSEIPSCEIDRLDLLLFESSLAAKISTEEEANTFFDGTKPVLVIGEANADLAALASVPVVANLPSDKFAKAISRRLIQHNDFRLTNGQGSLPAAKRQIVIVDDDESITSLACHALQRQPVECHVAFNSSQAIKLCQAVMPDLVVLDLNLREESGFDVLSCIRQDPGTKSASVMMLTGSNSVSDVQTALDLGAEDYCVKPFGLFHFRSRIELLLAKRAAL